MNLGFYGRPLEARYTRAGETLRLSRMLAALMAEVERLEALDPDLEATLTPEVHDIESLNRFKALYRDHKRKGLNEAHERIAHLRGILTEYGTLGVA